MLLSGGGNTSSLGVLATVDGLGAHVVLAVGALVRLRLDDLDPAAIGNVGDALVAVCAKVRYVLAHVSQAGNAGGADADAANEDTEEVCHAGVLLVDARHNPLLAERAIDHGGCWA